MKQRCPGCGREMQYDVGLRSGIKYAICQDCGADGLTPADIDDPAAAFEAARAEADA